MIKIICFTLLLLISYQPVQAQAPELPEPTPNQILGEKIVEAIKYHETKGKCHLKGLSGEKGCFQFLPSTYISYQKKYLGTTTLPLTPENEQRVMEAKVIDMLNKGFTPQQIALEHNTGRTKGECSRGINKWGVKYDSCKYVNNIIALIKTM